MNRNDWEKQVYASDLSTTARCIALVVGSFGNWTEERNVWPSTKAIADMAGMHRDTAQKYMDAFVEQGWLRVVRVRPGNIREYELCKAVAYPLGILSKSKRKGNLPNHQATGMGEQMPNHQATGNDEVSNQLPNHQASSCLVEQEQLPSGAVPVAYPLGTNLKEPTNKNLLELLEQDATVPDGPVDQEPLEVRDDSPTFLNFETTEPSLNLEDTDASLTTEVRPEPANTRKRFLNTLERREFNKLMDVYSVDEETALEALRIIQGSGGTKDISEAVPDALESLGMHVQMAGGW